LASIESGERYSGLLELKDLMPGTSYQTRVSVKTGSGLGRSSQMFTFTTAEKEVGEEVRRGEEEQVEEEKKEMEGKENEENDEEEMERNGKAVILPSHLPSPASDEEEQLLQESIVSATGDKVTKGEEEEEGSGQSRIVKFEEGSGEGSGKGASGSGPKVIGDDATAAMEKPKQEKSVSGGGADTNRSSNLHQNSALLFIVVAAFWFSK